MRLQATWLTTLVVLGALWLSGLCAARQPDTGSGEITLDKERFGVGNIARAGSWTGLRVQFTDSAPKQREIVLQVLVSDSDGDRVIQQREVTTNPGVKQGTWIYF